MVKSEIYLICPVCRSNLSAIGEGTKCNCGFKISYIAGVPVLRATDQEETLDYYSGKKELLHSKNSARLRINPIRNAFNRGDFMLELGAGIDICDAPNLVKTDAFVYSPYLDYVVDAHAMPFENNTFDFVYSLAVFEHLHSPWVAAKEIYRVLKPGGKVYILTAFMQHMHGYPSHYFNMTTMGLKRIFNDFEVIRCLPSKHCPLLQIGRIMQDLNAMTKALPENQDAQELSKHINKAYKFIPKIQKELIEQEANFDLWHKIAPGVEIVARKPA